MDDRADVLAACWFAHRSGPIVAKAINGVLANERDDPDLDLGHWLSDLEAEGLLEPIEGGWALTDVGRSEALREGTRMMAASFDASLVRHDASAGYREYCRRVYGTDRFQFNIVDQPQRAALLDVLGLKPGERFADLGCALGSMTAWIAEESGADGIGIDFAPGCIAVATQRYPNLEFRVGNLDSLELPELDAAVFLDTLYFCSDLEATVRTAIDSLKPGGRFAAFFTANKKRDEGLELERMRVGKALAACGLEPKGIDFTDEGHALWKRAAEVCDALEQTWKDEGNEKLWRNRVRESSAMIEKYGDGNARRWLVWATL